MEEKSKAIKVNGRRRIQKRLLNCSVRDIQDIAQPYSRSAMFDLDYYHSQDSMFDVDHVSK